MLFKVEKHSSVSLLLGAWSQTWQFVQSTSQWFVVMTCLQVSIPAAFVARKEKSSVLLSSMRKNACQFLGLDLMGQHAS
jgi:hypothetical protein